MNRFVLSVMLFFVPSLAVAQTAAPSVAVYGAFDRVSVGSPETFDAVFGTHMVSAPGGGVEVTRLWKGLFARAGASRGTLDGERVFVVNGDVIPLGIDVSARMTTFEFGGGWRFVPRTTDRVVPYVGAAIVSLRYAETSEFAESGENTDETMTGVAVFGGADIRITSRVFAGAEAQWRSIDSAPADGSVADQFGEKNLGGTVLRVRVGIRF
jgi:hypothetical protein